LLCRELADIVHRYWHVESVCFGACDQESAVVNHVLCMSSFLETDVRTVVLRTLSNRLTPVMVRYALVMIPIITQSPIRFTAQTELQLH